MRLFPERVMCLDARARSSRIWQGLSRKKRFMGQSAGCREGLFLALSLADSPDPSEPVYGAFKALRGGFDQNRPSSGETVALLRAHTGQTARGTLMKKGWAWRDGVRARSAATMRLDADGHRA